MSQRVIASIDTRINSSQGYRELKYFNSAMFFGTNYDNNYIPFTSLGLPEYISGNTISITYHNVSLSNTGLDPTDVTHSIYLLTSKGTQGTSNVTFKPTYGNNNITIAEGSVRVEIPYNEYHNIVSDLSITTTTSSGTLTLNVKWNNKQYTATGSSSGMRRYGGFSFPLTNESSISNNIVNFRKLGYVTIQVGNNIYNIVPCDDRTISSKPFRFYSSRTDSFYEFPDPGSLPVVYPNAGRYDYTNGFSLVERAVANDITDDIINTYKEAL